MTKKDANNNQQIFGNIIYMLRFIVALNKKFIFCKLTLVVTDAILPFIPMLLLRFVLNEITAASNWQHILFYVIVGSAAWFVLTLFKNGFTLMFEKELKMTLYQLKQSLGQGIMKIPYEQLEDPKMRNLLELAKDTNQFNEMMDHISRILTHFMMITGLITIILLADFRIMAIATVVIALRLFMNKKIRNIWGTYRPLYGPIMNKSFYFFSLKRDIEYGKEVRLNQIENLISKKHQESTNDYLNVSRKHNISLRNHNMIVDVALIIQEIAVYGILGFQVIYHNLSIGDFSLLLATINQFSGSMIQIATSFSDLQVKGLLLEEFRYCMELVENVDDENSFQNELSGRDYKIEFKNVFFKYPNNEHNTLENISFTLNPQETISIVGENGAGKTTLVKLMCRLYRPTSGEILINGIPIFDISEQDYAQFLGVVFQDFQMLGFSIQDNIVLEENHDQARLGDAIEKSDLKQMVGKLKHGAETYINKEFSEEGVGFSGGERQKIALARAIYKDAPIMILDEPTSALDPIAEYELYRQFSELVKGKSAIYISHRLTSTRFTDKIIVLSKGKIEEYGDHQTLMKMEQGIYRELFLEQAQYYNFN